MTTFKTHSAGYLANHMARLFAKALAESIRPLGLAPAQFMVLLELWREDGVTQKHLVERLDVEQATMASTLARMERDGFIERRPDPADARARIIHLTGRARELEQAALAEARQVNRRALAGFPEEEAEQLLAGMRRVISSLSDKPAEPGLPVSPNPVD
ncbi:MarR family winged helix-turn-helix transcriptional regulator [Bosea sp. BIWAKO-01]|uniref:MarR family winged helix-turn-helix transcriptional regulator n=1 Tax=Bosea sp. BIWAKO-01 TaxID=506668 RepID=UPI0008534CE8|nr:MarR family transcriptional regulator [Bosea sp. BIWAKO-01]GAU81605.1 transcriptional regulator [Bosea sp. BIWAKO-01]